MIYHLEIEVYVDQYYNLCSMNSFYSNVYTTYEQAFDEGNEEVNRRIKDLKDK